REVAALCSGTSWRAAVTSSKAPAATAPTRIGLREFLLGFIGDYASWSASRNKEFVSLAQRLTAIAHEALGAQQGTLPLVADPFAGGGAIPLEALRAGADAVASDLNPVAVLLNKVALEFAPRFGTSLVNEVSQAGEQVSAAVADRLRNFFPTSPDQTPVAYLWARTAECEGPACGTKFPLL